MKMESPPSKTTVLLNGYGFRLQERSKQTRCETRARFVLRIPAAFS
jgi:hypothetical protein